jgi:hypothetical protein
MAANQTQIMLRGIIPDGSALAVQVPQTMQLPGSITLKSAAAGRLIELSTDGGTEYFAPAVDVQSGTMQIVVVNAPITHFRVTGAAADTYLVS